MEIKERFSKIWNHPYILVAILFGFCLFLYFLNLGQWDLWNPDEPRYAQVAREMVQRGDWVLMHFNGQVYGDKPPLFFWLIAISSYLCNGFSSFSVRFPSAIFGTLTILLTFLIGKNLYSSRTGFLSGLILTTSLEFAYLATRANIDATLTFFTTASFFCFIKWYQNKTPHPQRERGNVEGHTLSIERETSVISFFSERDEKWSYIIYGFYIGMGLATLTKGPVGFILPLLVVLVYLIIQRDWNALRRMKLISGIIIFIIIVLSWYVPALLKGGREYFNETIMLHTIDRFAKGSSHIRPFYYYLYNFPVDFLPWILFLPSAIFYCYLTDRLRKRKEFLFLLIWFIVIFVFFSISKGKRGLYLLPLFPAVSILVGRFWEGYISNRLENFSSGWIKIPLYLLMIVSFAGGVILILVGFKRFPDYLPWSIPITLLMVLGGMALFISYRLKFKMIQLFIIFGMMAVGLFYTQRVIFPIINPYKSARFISHEITSRIKPDEKLLTYGDFVIAPYLYYTGIIPIIEIEKEEDLLNFLKSEKRIFCLMKFRDFKQFQKTEIGQKIELITRRNVGGDDMVLISNK